ncbi:hypothetical protein BCR43DRAFT_499251 [Syncephalastrum racemosum]|uniref:Uncharacterized protein n=1 Tax=Syncephalastrum racemosum TaxID=13706 RepID=A0A1X2H014_SYNRA|nr:hypothetical protein BCR43DRAFT_499251 [Syncephalastrum racemosum]
MCIHIWVLNISTIRRSHGSLFHGLRDLDCPLDYHEVSRMTQLRYAHDGGPYDIDEDSTIDDWYFYGASEDEEEEDEEEDAPSEEKKKDYFKYVHIPHLDSPNDLGEEQGEHQDPTSGPRSPASSNSSSSSTMDYLPLAGWMPNMLTMVESLTRR